MLTTRKGIWEDPFLTEGRLREWEGSEVRHISLQTEPSGFCRCKFTIFNTVLNSTVHKIAWYKAGEWVSGSLVSLIVFWQFAKINAILQAPWNGNTALSASINSPAPDIFGKSRLKPTKDPGKSLQKLPLHWRRNASKRPPQGSGHAQTSDSCFGCFFLLRGFSVSP